MTRARFHVTQAIEQFVPRAHILLSTLILLIATLLTDEVSLLMLAWPKGHDPILGRLRIFSAMCSLRAAKLVLSFLYYLLSF